MVSLFHFSDVIVDTADLPGSFDVDIGINNVDGIKGADVLNGYLASMPALRPLVLVLKGFLSRRDLNNAGKCGLGSYALICMCISFLQVCASYSSGRINAYSL